MTGEQKSVERLRQREQQAFAYIRRKVNELLSIMGTAPLRPEELDDETLLELDPIGIIGTSFTQILDHLKDTNRELKEARDEIAAIFDTAGVGILVLDRKMRVSAYNKKQVEFFVKHDTDILGSTCCAVMCGRSGKGEGCTFEMVMAAGRPVHQKAWACHDRYFDVIGAPLRDGDGNISHVILSYNEITERKRAEERLRIAKQELERQNRELMQIDNLKDGLIRDVSHELKTPVAKHIMQLEILKPLIASDRITTAERKAFTIMSEGIRRQEKVISNLLDLSRLEAGGMVIHREEIRVGEFFSRIVGDFNEPLKQFDARAFVDVSDVVMVSDRDMLWHVFTNIFGNALKFRRNDVPLQITVTAEAEHGELLINVTDNGIGMDTGALEKAFERFYQHSPSAEGSGIGLAICHRIVVNLGGRISVASPGPGEGVTVSVSLPLGE